MLILQDQQINLGPSLFAYHLRMKEAISASVITATALNLIGVTSVLLLFNGPHFTVTASMRLIVFIMAIASL